MLLILLITIIFCGVVNHVLSGSGVRMMIKTITRFMPNIMPQKPSVFGNVNYSKKAKNPNSHYLLVTNILRASLFDKEF